MSVNITFQENEFVLDNVTRIECGEILTQGRVFVFRQGYSDVYFPKHISVTIQQGE